MKKTLPPQISFSNTGANGEPIIDHEALVDVFGQCYMWLRQYTVATSREIIDNPTEASERLGTLGWKKYERISELCQEDKTAALLFAEETVDRFAILILTLLGGTGPDIQIDDTRAIRFRLEAEVFNIESDDAQWQEVISQSGQRFFADYWGRWLNRYGGKNEGNVSTPEIQPKSEDET